MGGTIREVNDTSATERTAVCDFDKYFIAVVGIGDFENSPERIGAMCTGKTVMMQPFTAAGPGSR